MSHIHNLVVVSETGIGLLVYQVSIGENMKSIACLLTFFKKKNLQKFLTLYDTFLRKQMQVMSFFMKFRIIPCHTRYNSNKFRVVNGSIGALHASLTRAQ